MNRRTLSFRVDLLLANMYREVNKGVIYCLSLNLSFTMVGASVHSAIAEHSAGQHKFQ
jgi:hypothetical protein